MGSVERYAVVDCETTGLYNSDRIVEIAVIMVGTDGTVQAEFESLVNPRRDVGPTWLHGVTASMIADAPVFEELIEPLAAYLDGAVLVAHNLAFDVRMLTAELTRIGVAFDAGLGVDTLRHSGAKLSTAASNAGIDLEGAHSAIGDARCCAQLLTRLIDPSSLDLVPASMSSGGVSPTRIKTRSAGTARPPDPPYLAGLVIAADRRAQEVTPYRDLLLRVIDDLAISPSEGSQLKSIALDLGLDSTAIDRTHREMLEQMIDEAVADGVVTQDEYETLCRAAVALGVDVDLVNRHTRSYRVGAGSVALGGQRVCFTGAAQDAGGALVARSQLNALAAERGLAPVSDVSAKGCDLLVAQDPSSQSGKAAKARRAGIPIASVADFLVSATGGALKVESVEVIDALPIACSECGATAMVKRRPRPPYRCAACK